jgi:2-dehydropantoate 2-reductase
MRFLVLGAGGVGGYFGGRLAQNGADVTFLVRERRRDQLIKDGLRIESPMGDARFPVKAVMAAELAAEFDVILLTCKSYDLDSSIEAIAPGLKPGGVVLPLLNGLVHLDLLNARFGVPHVLGGIAKIAATLASDGVVKHLNDWRFITLGEQTGELSDRATVIAAAFPTDSVVANATATIVPEMWEKLVHLSTAAAMTCLMRASVGEIAATPDGTKLFLRLFDLATAIATANGCPPSDAFLSSYRRLFSNPTSGYTTSMLRDIQAGHRIEADHIVGFMLKKAREAGLDATLLEIAYTHLKVYEAQRVGGQEAPTRR